MYVFFLMCVPFISFFRLISLTWISGDMLNRSGECGHLAFFSVLVGKQYRRCWFHPWVGKISWRRKWQPTPVFLPGKSNGQMSLEDCSPCRKKLGTTE